MNLSVLESILKAYLKSLLSIPYIPEHFLSPEGYTSGLASSCTRVAIWSFLHLSVTSTLQAIRLSYPYKE